MESDTRLTLSQVSNDYELVCPGKQVRALKQVLDRIAAEHLPKILAGHELPMIEPDHTVYRIRNISVNLTINRDALKNGLLPRLWAGQIIEKVFYEMRFGNNGNVKRFKTHAHFVAAFIGHLLTGDARQSWVYEEFSALRHLNAAEAVTQMLTARPLYFPVITAVLAKQHRVERLMDTLNDGQSQRILDALGSSFPATSDIDDWLDMLTAVGPLVEWRRFENYSRARRHLFLLMQIAAKIRPHEQRFGQILTLSRHLTSIQSVMKKQDDLFQVLRQWIKKRSVGPETLREVKGKNEYQTLAKLIRSLTEKGLSPEWTEFLGNCAGHPKGEAYLIRLWEMAAVMIPKPVSPRDRKPEAFRETDPAGPRSPRIPTETIEFYSSYTGFALLLMIVKDLKLYERLTMSQLQRIFIFIAEDGQKDRCMLDPFWGAIFPIKDPTRVEPSWPRVNAGMVTDMDDAQADEIKQAAGPEAWIRLVLHRFSRRLPGLETSSPGYLFNQFLLRSGRIRITERSVMVSLHQIPLGIVLRMAGFSGWQGRIPWLDQRDLTIDIPAG